MSIIITLCLTCHQALSLLSSHLVSLVTPSLSCHALCPSFHPHSTISPSEAADQAREAVQQAVLSEMQEEVMAQTLNFVDDDDDEANQEEEFALWKVRLKAGVKESCRLTSLPSLSSLANH